MPGMSHDTLAQLLAKANGHYALSIMYDPEGFAQIASGLVAENKQLDNVRTKPPDFQYLADVGCNDEGTHC